MLQTLKKLHELLNSIDDPVKKKIIGNHLDAFYWKIYIADYHIKEGIEVINNQNDVEPDIAYVEIIKDIFGYYSKSERGINYRIAVFKSEANLIAAANSIHSFADICAHIIYRSLTDLQNTIEEKKIGIKSLKRELEKKSEYKNIVDVLKSLIDSKEFKYLEAYVNTTKHKMLIPTSPTVSFKHQEETEQYLQINDFEYDGECFAPKKSSELTGIYYEAMKAHYKIIFEVLIKLLDDEIK